MGSHWENLGHFEHQKRIMMIKDTLNFKSSQQIVSKNQSIVIYSKGSLLGSL